MLDLSAGVSIRQAPVIAARWPGAAAIAVVALEQISPEQIARLVEGRPAGNPNLNAVATPLVWLSPRAAAVLLGAAPGTLNPGATGPTVNARLGFTSNPVSFPARNVVAILPGSDPVLRGQYVALTAHNDHVGFDHAPVDHDSVRAFDRVVRPMGADSPPREATAAEWVRIRQILSGNSRLSSGRTTANGRGASSSSPTTSRVGRA